RGVPDDWAHERPHRGHESIDQTGETRRLRLQEPGQLSAQSTVALHPANPPIVSEEPDGARLRSKSLFPPEARADANMYPAAASSDSAQTIAARAATRFTMALDDRDGIEHRAGRTLDFQWQRDEEELVYRVPGQLLKPDRFEQVDRILDE